MMNAYSYFGDVVFFDTTYKKNKECHLFAMFLKVNHHKQPTIFGATLLYDETTQIFKWLFDAFVKAMSEKKAKNYSYTSRCSDGKGISFRMPKTYHHLYIWYIYKNAAKHLSSVFVDF